MESTPEQAAEGLAIVRVLATVLERLVCANAGMAVTDPGQVTKFHALKAPGIGILPYLERIHKYASCSNECFILALIYIDRLIQRNNFLLTELNVHRVIISAILLAAKFFDDAYYNNAYYSKVGGVLVSEMNGLEVDFLFRINFSLHVTPELFEKYKAELVAHSINSGITIPQNAVSNLQMPNSNAIMASDQQPVQVPVSATSVPVPIQAHVPPQVTPSPSSHAATMNTTTPQQVEPSRVEPNPMQHNMYVAENLFPNVTASQPNVQRANSLPFPSHSGRCLANNPPYSAPMVSMLPAGFEEQYVVVSNQIFPLQTTLVHHNHAVDKYHDQNSYQHATAGYPLTRENVGPLVAGHY